MVPEKAEELIELAENIIAKHLQEAAGSPLKIAYIAEMNYKLKNAKHQHEEGMKFQKLAEAAFLERNIILGIDATQGGDAYPVGTLKYLLSLIAEALLELDARDEQNLEEWGFET